MVEEKFRENFRLNRGMRAKFNVIRSVFGRILSENGKMETQNMTLAKFQIRISFRDIKIRIQRPRFGLNPKSQLILNVFFTKS